MLRVGTSARVSVPVRPLDEGLPLPGARLVGDAGADLFAREPALLAAGGGRALVSTGVAVAIPAGLAGLVLPRSGLALCHGVTCLNSPGLIDSGYRGELKVLLVNTDPTTPYQVHRGDRVAQLIVVALPEVAFVVSEMLEPSERGEGGFGHTGR